MKKKQLNFEEKSNFARARLFVQKTLASRKALVSISDKRSFLKFRRCKEKLVKIEINLKFFICTLVFSVVNDI